MTRLTDPPAIIEQQRQSEFVCSACGAGRECDCNAPALKRLAKLEEKREQHRQANRRRMREKRQQDQRSGSDTGNIPDEQRIVTALDGVVQLTGEDSIETAMARKVAENHQAFSDRLERLEDMAKIIEQCRTSVRHTVTSSMQRLRDLGATDYEVLFAT